MSIDYDKEGKESAFSQVELIPPVQSSLINPSMSMSDLLNVAQSASFNPTLLQDSPTIPPDTSNDAGVQILSSGKFQSPNYSMGLVGWNIDSDGNAEFNNGTFRGTFVLGGVIITINNINNLQSAINTVGAQGGGIVNLEPGTYNATASFTYLNGVTIDGNGAVIDFGGTANNFSAIGTNPYSTGTLAVNFGSGSVTGTGTIWTAAMIGQSILIGDYWYLITARASNTAITISPVFRAPNVSGVTYVIVTTITGVNLKNITLTNNITNPLFDFRYCDGLVMDGLITTSSPQGIRGRDSANLQWLGSTIQNCTAGMLFNNVPYCTLSNFTVLDITGGTGMDLIGVTNTAISPGSIQRVTGVGMKFTNCLNLGFLNYSIIETTSHGIEFVSGNSDVDLASGYINTAGGDGVKLTASSNRISITTTNVFNTTGYQFNIANANCNNNMVSTNSGDGTGSGAIQNLGTSTRIAPDNVGFSGNIVEGDLSLTDITTNNASTSKHGFLPKLSNVSTQFLDGTGAFSTPASGGLPEQSIPYVTSTNTAFATTSIVGSNNTGTVMYQAYMDASGTLNITIKRLAKDATTGQWYVTHSTTLATAGINSGPLGFAVIGSSVYLSYNTNNTDAIKRYVAADLTSPTTITFSGTSHRGPAFTDGTDLYICYNANTATKFTISGTVATNAADRTFTGMVVGQTIASDGTTVWQATATSGGDLAIKKWTLSSGSLISTSSTILLYWDVYPNAGSIGTFNGGIGVLGLGFGYTIESNSAVRGSAIKLQAVAAP